MGRLRRKVDGPNEAHMIRNVRGVGFVLSATSFPKDSTRAVPETLSKLASPQLQFVGAQPIARLK
jgi:hypothetical protein